MNLKNHWKMVGGIYLRSREHKPFCHELKHILLRLENTPEGEDIPSSSSPGAMSGDLDLDCDWDSEAGDFLDDPKYTTAGLGAGGPQSAARARSESLLRSSLYSNRNRVIAPIGEGLQNIQQTAASPVPFGLVGNEDENYGGVAGEGADI